MGCESLFYSLLLTLAVALITYNVLVALNTPPTVDGLSKLGDDVRSADPIIRMPLDFKNRRKEKRLFHTALTATDSIYNSWQCRVMYYWYKQFKDKPGSEMGGFTRVLHSGKPDKLMDEIPTFVADPLPAGMDQGYIVLNRPWAFVQWLEKAHIEEEYILMAEPDHLIVKPIPNLAMDDLPAAFPFFYIVPKDHESIVRRYFPKEKGPVTNIDPIGNSPVIIKKASLEKIAPTWLNVSLAMKNDPEADKAFGWVLEMYAYAIASALHGVQHILHKDFMIQGKLTYGKIGEWRFDKRSFGKSAPPRNLPLPPSGVPESVVTLVKMVNEATANIPNWE